MIITSKLSSWFILTALMLLPNGVTAATYEIDPAHSSADFSIRHMMVSNVRGSFTKIQGTVTFDPKDPTKTTIDATIKADSIDTHNTMRDEHLKGEEFFEVAKYPTITFKSTKAQAPAAGKLLVTGVLTLHGTGKEVVLVIDNLTPEVKDPRGNTLMGASAQTKINRKDFGMKWNAPVPTGGVVIGEDVAITLDIELTKKP